MKPDPEVAQALDLPLSASSALGSEKAGHGPALLQSPILPVTHPNSKDRSAPQVSGLRSQVSPCAAFTLLEVVIAVGIFATAVVTLLALLPATLRESADSLDTQTVLRLPGAIETELHRLVDTHGFDAFAARIPVLNASTDHGELLVAAHQGDDVRRLAAGESPMRDQYFLIELQRFASGPLAYDPAGTVLPLCVRVSWPYRRLAPEGLPPALPASERHTLTFTLALNR